MRQTSFKGVSRVKIEKLTQTSNSSFRYIDDFLPLSSYQFDDYLPLIYPNELEVKDTTDTKKYASYIDLHIEIDNRVRLKTRFYDKHDDFTFPIGNSSYIPASPAHRNYI